MAALAVAAIGAPYGLERSGNSRDWSVPQNLRLNARFLEKSNIVDPLPLPRSRRRPRRAPYNSRFMFRRTDCDLTSDKTNNAHEGVG